MPVPGAKEAFRRGRGCCRRGNGGSVPDLRGGGLVTPIPPCPPPCDVGNEADPGCRLTPDSSLFQSFSSGEEVGNEFTQEGGPDWCAALLAEEGRGLPVLEGVTGWDGGRGTRLMWWEERGVAAGEAADGVVGTRGVVCPAGVDSHIGRAGGSPRGIGWKVGGVGSDDAPLSDRLSAALAGLLEILRKLMDRCLCKFSWGG